MQDFRIILAALVALFGGQTVFTTVTEENRFEERQQLMSQEITETRNLIKMAIQEQNESEVRMILNNQNQIVTALTDILQSNITKADSIQMFLTELRYLAEGKSQYGTPETLGSE